MPRMPSIAGSRVIADRTVNSTVSAAATATPLRNETPSTSMPSRAMHTVPPANSTARPEVFRATATESIGWSPRLSPRRYRVTMNSA